MQKYIHKQKHLIVEAAQVNEDTVVSIANWAGAQIVEEKDALTHEGQEALNIKTPAGKKRASSGMYVLKFDDQFFVSNPGQFERIYTPFEAIQSKKQAREQYPTPRPVVRDPFEGMTRFSEGPKP